MKRFGEIKDVLDFLESVPKFGHKGQSAANFNLERMNLICSMMGSPQNRFKSIHVAGTNGKGTVCRMLASVYQEAGFKTALYTSPHLISVKERFKVNGDMIHSEQMVRFFQLYGEMLISYNATYFEITTALAFWYFDDEGVDIAILETGLGGRLDATNVVDPIASVITSVGKDHTDILGDDLSLIAAEKGGIIKKNRPVFTGQLNRTVQSVIQDMSEKRAAPFYTVSDNIVSFSSEMIVIDYKGDRIPISVKNLKSVDAVNVSLVLDVVMYLKSLMNVELSQFVEGIERLNQKYPSSAVFEKLIEEQPWYFDGAHNLDAMTALVEHLSLMGEPAQWKVVLSFMSDKLNDQVAVLWNTFPNIYLYGMESPRSADMDLMKRYFPNAKEFQPEFLNEKNHFKSELVIFSGSFYFYGTVREWMGAMTTS